MPTAVFFHAHPDDESILTAGTMAKLAAEGHRVVLVTATDGRHGEVKEGFLDPGETLGDRRRAELESSAAALGVARLVLLGYRDSGMVGTEENDHPDSFHSADVDEAAARVVDILRAEDASLLTIYDEHGGYGHPDHIKIHTVGKRAAELAGTPACYVATINRDRAIEVFTSGREGMSPEERAETLAFLEDVGVVDAEITTAVDVSGFLEDKRRSMEAHRSQIDPESWPLSLPPEVFAAAFSTEWYVHVGVSPGGRRETDLVFGEPAAADAPRPGVASRRPR